jgi:hypothetical protein
MAQLNRFNFALALSILFGGTLLWGQGSTPPGGGGGGGGSVSSVGLVLPPEFTVTGSPVTSIGTLTGAWNVVSANLVFAGPDTGADDVPTFRLLVEDDIPALSISKTTGLQTALDGKAANTIQINAGAGLSGGGNLTANRTLSLAPPGASTLGGVLTKTCDAGDFIRMLDTDGVFTCGTPSGGGGSITDVTQGNGIVVITPSAGVREVSVDPTLVSLFVQSAGNPNTEAVPGAAGRIAYDTTDDYQPYYWDVLNTTWVAFGSGGGGGSISGSIAANQVAIGSGTDTIGGSSDFTKTNSNFIVNMSTQGTGCYQFRSGGSNRWAANCSSGSIVWTTWNSVTTNAGPSTNNGVAHGVNSLGVVQSTTDTTATNITSGAPAAGLYRLNVYCSVTTTEAGRTADVTFSWTDAIGATSAAPCGTAIDLTTAVRAQAVHIIEIASGTPQVDVAYTGGSTGIIKVNFTLERIK